MSSYICGGSVYYLISLLRQKKLDEVILKAIQSESIIYSGTSAGSIIVSKNLTQFSYDEEEKEYIQKIPDNKGLGLVDFGIVPHCNNVDFVNEHKKIVEQMPYDPTPLIFLQDTQAIWVENDRMRLVAV